MKRNLGQQTAARVLFLLVSLAAACPAWAADARPPLRWAADAEGGAPYIFKNPKNPDENLGFEVDLVHALEGELGRKIEFVQYQFPSLIVGVNRGDFDFAMNGVEVTPDREKVVRFSRPYYVYSLQLAARADETRFDSLAKCHALGGVVGTLDDTAAKRLLDRMGVRTKVYEGQTEPYLDLAAGRIDAVLLDLPIAIYYAKPNPQLKFVGEPMEQGLYAAAFAKGREDLAAEFDAALERIAARGQLRSIYEKWGLWNADQETLGILQKQDVLRESERGLTFARYFPLLLQGALVTIEISALGMTLAVALGLPLALLRLSHSRPLRLAATVYVEFFRGIPVLLLLFFLYYGLPALGARYGLENYLNLPAFWVAVFGFGLNYAAYESEIYRAGIRSIPIGQWEAAASLGMSRAQTFFRIILPQAIRVILPPMTNDFIALFKDTSLVSVIAVVELTKQYQMLAKSSTKYFEIGLATAALYLVMSVPLGHLSRYLEKRWGKGH
jgi:polar amino acid transport system substrate-binding protein